MAIDNYQRAIDLRNTLSMGNVASIYLNAGFEKLAKSLVAEAEEQETIDGNVAEVAARAVEARTAQAKELADLQTQVSATSETMASLAAARFQSTPPQAASGWSVDGKAVEVQVNSSDLVATWNVGSFRSGRRFSGKITGAIVSGVFEKEGPSYGPDWESDGSGYLILDRDGYVPFVSLSTKEVKRGRFSRTTETPSSAGG